MARNVLKERRKKRGSFKLNTSPKPQIQRPSLGQLKIEFPFEPEPEPIKVRIYSTPLKKYEYKQLEINFNVKEPISIIIPAYQTQDFIEECLDSIERQTYFEDNNNYEILLGIDSCDLTLDKIIEIKSKYKNLNVYTTSKNVGPYIIKNSLIEISKHDNLIFFDSDDIMIPNMISSILEQNHNNLKIVRWGYSNIRIFPTPRHYKKKLKGIAEGVFFCKKSIFRGVGGFESWKCGADTDFKKRTLNIYKPKIIRKPLFYRRIHPNSLTQHPDTKKDNINNPLGPERIRVFNLMKNKKYDHSDIYVKPVLTKLKLIK